MDQMRVFGYARVSGAEQGKHGTSLGAQQDEIRRYCELHRLPKPTLFVEVESADGAKLERRVELARLLELAGRGDLVLVTRVDRWSRDIAHAVNSVRELVARGVRWVAISDSIDAATPHGDSTLGIMAWAADQERRRIRDRTVGRRKALRDEGKYVEGPAPVGYRRARGHVLEVVPDEAAVIQALFERCAEGQSLRELAASLARDFDFHRDKQPLHRMIRNRVYLGEVKDSKGVWLPQIHEPIVSPELWARAHTAIAKRRLGGRKPSSQSRTAAWLLRSLAVCAACGRRMTSAYVERRKGVYTDYYLCRGRQTKAGCMAPYVPVKRTDALMGDLALDRLHDLREELGRPPARARKDRHRQQSTAQLDRKRERLIDMAADGTITVNDLRQRLKAVDERLAEVAARAEAERRRNATHEPEIRRQLSADTGFIRQSWAQIAVPERREIVTLLAARVAIAADREPEVAWREPGDLRQELSRLTCS